LLSQNHINSRHNCTENDIINILIFLIDTIFVVFGQMMLQQTTYNRK